MTDRKISGVITPLLTPFEDDRSLAADLYVGHARWVLDQGAHVLAPFGTTGEATSVPRRDRMAALEALIDGGIAPDRLMPGTGLCALEETLELTRHAVEAGCAAVMVLPPFFYVNAADDGLYRYFSALIEGIASSALRICLYHIPPMTRIGFSPALAARLNAAFPETVIAIKDSSGDWNNTRALLEEAPGLAVFPGSETYLRRALEAGGAGCISATCNINAARIREVYELCAGGGSSKLDRLDEAMRSLRRTVESAGNIPAMKAILAVRSGDRRWLNLRPPLVSTSLEHGRALIERLGGTVDHIAAAAA
jgi:4-hydroxy-tetrahydrodipicolinate synthase